MSFTLPYIKRKLLHSMSTVLSKVDNDESEALEVCLRLLIKKIMDNVKEEFELCKENIIYGEPDEDNPVPEVRKRRRGQHVPDIGDNNELPERSNSPIFINPQSPSQDKLQNNQIDIPQMTKSTKLESIHMVPCSVYSAIVSSSAAFGGFLFGYEIGMVDAILRMDVFGEKYGIKVIDPTSNLLVNSSSAADIKGNITLLFLLGCIVGAAIVSWLADTIGRKRSIIIGSCIFAVGGVLQALSTNVIYLFFGRVISGFGIGILSMSVPLYISETAPTQIRGRMISIQQLMITMGIVIASIVNSIIFVTTTGEFQWRLAFAFQCIPGVFLLIIMIFMPNSPRWLIKNDRDSEAIRIISKLKASESKSNLVQNEYNDIKNGIAYEVLMGPSSWSELSKRGIMIRVIIAVLLQTFQQWSGINIILYYAGDLFSEMGIRDTSTSSIFVIVNSMVNIISCFPGMYLIERIGRKKLLIIGGFGMGISHFLICLFTALSTQHTIYSWFAVISVYMFISFFSATWGPVVWVYQSEIFPTRIRAKATGLATIANWSWNAVIAKISPLLFKQIGLYTYLIFGTFGIIMAVYALLFVPETMGKRIEEMDDLFGAKTNRTTIEQNKHV